MKTTVGGKMIFEIEHFLSEDECDQLLNPRLSEFKRANTHYPEYYRNNGRVEDSNVGLADMFLKRIQSSGISGFPKVVGLNEKFRYCKYSRGEQFTKHQDGTYYPNDKLESRYTFLLYLNDAEEFEGGSTLFFMSSIEDKIAYEIRPKKGKLVVFDHTIWHSGSTVLRGDKYVLRSDFFVPRMECSTGHNGYIWCLEKVNDCMFLSGGRDTSVRLWNDQLEQLNVFNFHKKSVLQIKALNDDIFVSSSRDMTVKKWSLQDGLLASINTSAMVVSVACFDGRIVTGNTNGELIVYSENLDEVIKTKVHFGWIWGVCIAENVIYSVSDDGRLCATTFNGETQELYQHDEELFSILSTRLLLYLGTKSGKIFYHEYNGNIIHKMHDHTSIVRNIRFTENGILSCSEDGKIVLNSRTVLQENYFVQDALLSRTGIISAGFNGKLRLIDSTTNETGFKLLKNS